MRPQSLKTVLSAAASLVMLATPALAQSKSRTEQHITQMVNAGLTRACAKQKNPVYAKECWSHAYPHVFRSVMADNCGPSRETLQALLPRRDFDGLALVFSNATDCLNKAAGAVTDQGLKMELENLGQETKDFSASATKKDWSAFQDLPKRFSPY